MPFVRPVVKLAATAGATAEIPGLVDEAFAVARRPHTGPGVPRLPARRRLHGGRRRGGGRGPRRRAPSRPTAPRSSARVALLDDAERPVIMAGTNLYWGRGEGALRALAEARGIPVFLNGLARGCVPADHELAFARARKTALERGRRRARRRRADGLPARLRRGVRRETRDRRDRRRRARARAPARGRRRALRRPAVDAERARPASGAGHDGLGRAAARDRDREARGRARAARRTRARRCTRCASTASSPRCSTATRS